MKISKFSIVFLCVLFFTNLLQAQIALSPSFVFMDKNSGVGDLFVTNNSQKSYEISINFLFGYPDSDADGNLVMNYKDSTAYNQFALDEMIRAFPRRFILKAGEQRTVRLQIIPNQRKREGYFFTRMKVMSKPQASDVSDSITTGIGSKINVNIEQITAVFYHKGNVSTGLTVKSLDIRQNEGKLELRPQLERTGNSPFLGSMFAKLKDAKGNVVSEIQNTTTVYFDEIRRMDLKLDKVTPGTYTLELSFESHRNDMMIGDLIQIPKLVQSTTVVIK